MFELDRGKTPKKDGVQYAGDQWLATGVATIEKGVAQRKEKKIER